MPKSVKNFKITKFQKKVYRCAMSIPFGQARTYKWVAKKIGSPKAARAVGTALRKNPFVLFVPCHRVVKSKGSIGNYSLGRALKQRLINLEKTRKDMIE